MLSACKSKQISQKLDKHSGASAIREIQIFESQHIYDTVHAFK